MAKTANAVNAKRTKIELVINAAWVAALASLSTAETVDFSSVTKSISGGELTRETQKEYVTGDAAPIIDQDTDLVYSDIVITFLYTNGKDTVGSDNIDVGAVLDEMAVYVASQIPLPVIWSVAGGAVGDEERISDASETYIKGLTPPVGGVDSTGKVQRTLTLGTSSILPATVS